MRTSTRLALLLPLLLVSTLGVAGVLLWRADRELARRQTEEILAGNLVAAVRTAAPFLDAVKHRKIGLGLKSTSDEWKELRATLQAIATANDLSYEHCYTFSRPTDDGSQLRWAVMLHDKPFVGDVYQVPAENQPLVRQLLERKAPVATRIYRDAHGEWLSAMAPLVTPQGEVVGVLQMDYTAADVLGRTAQSLGERRQRVFFQTAIAGLVGLALTGLLLWSWFVRPLQEVVDFADGLSQGHSMVELSLDAHGEMAHLIGSLNRLHGRLSGMMANARATSEVVANLTARLYDASRHLAGDSDTQARAAEDTSGFVVKVDKSAQQVSHASGRVTNLVIETTASIEEMMAQVNEIDRSAASLSQSTNVTASAVQQMGANIGEVAQNADQLSQQVADVAVAVEQMRRSIQHVQKNGEDLLRGADGAASGIAGTMDSIREVERSAQTAERLAQIVVTDAENGRARVRSTIEGMGAIQTAISEVVEVIAHLERSGQAIGEILDLIEKVAEQTNVLALNAALIAAHAGDEGKAFGVVAAKIRELSASTSERTKDIARLVTGVKGDVDQATTVAQRAKKAAERGAGFAGEAGAALEKILGSAREASQLSQGIARATVDQLLLGVQIAESMDRVKGQIAEISRATGEELTASTRLVETMESVREKATLFRRATVELRTGSGQIVSAIENVATQVKEISRATQEQAKGGKAITRAIVEMERAALELTNAATEQSRDSRKAVDAVIAIGEIVHRNSGRVAEIDKAASVLAEQSMTLLKDVSSMTL